MDLKDAERISGRILVMGDSISDDGRYITYMNAYLRLCNPSNRTVFLNAGVSGETVSGLTEPTHPFPRPNGLDRLDRALEITRPDWVLIAYGMNDGIYYPPNEERLEAFRHGIREAVRRIKSTGARTIVLTPPPFDAASFEGQLYPEGEADYAYNRPYQDYDRTLALMSDWILNSGETGADHVADIRIPLLEQRRLLREQNPEAVCGDGIHPDGDGHWMIACTLLKALMNRSVQEFLPGMMQSEEGRRWMEIFREQDREAHILLKEEIGHDLPVRDSVPDAEELKNRHDERIAEMDCLAARGRLAEREDEFRGYRMLRFFFGGYAALVVFPGKAAADRRWAVRTEFFGAFADADEALLRHGYHIAYLRQPDRYGTPETARTLESFRRYMSLRFDLNPKIGLIGLSRGGLYAAHYAGMYPEHTAALYLDAPVVDIVSWPMGGKSEGEKLCARECLREYGLTAENLDAFYRWRDGLHRIAAESGIPLILIAGDSDTVVPYEENGLRLEKIWREKALPFAFELKPGIGHHPHGPTDPEAVASFWDEQGLW